VTCPLRVPFVSTTGYLVAAVICANPPDTCGWGKGGRHELAALFSTGIGLIGLLPLAVCWSVALYSTAARGTGRAVTVWVTGLLAVALAGTAVAAVSPPYCR
jgi:hypothetical protein